MPVIAWLVGRTAGPILAGVSAFLLAVVIGQWLITSTRIVDLRIEKESAEAQLKIANENLGTCHANVVTLTASVDRMGADIRGLSEASKAAGERAEAAAKQASAFSREAKLTADRVLALPKPPPGMECSAAARVLRGVAP